MSARTKLFSVGSALTCCSAIAWISSCGSFSGSSSPAIDAGAIDGSTTTQKPDAEIAPDSSADAGAVVPPTTVTVLAQGQPTAIAIAVGSQGVYWALTKPGEIERFPFGGAAPTPFFDEKGAPSTLTAFGGTLVIGDDGQSTLTFVDEKTGQATSTVPISAPPRWLAHSVIASAVLWTSSAPLVGVGMNPDDGKNSPTSITGNGTNPWGIAIDGTLVAWCDSAAAIVWSIDLQSDGTFTPPQMVDSQAEDCRAVAVAGTSIYWTTGGGDVEVSVAGAAATPIVTGQVGPDGIVADATGAYWIERGNAAGEGSLWFAAAGATNATMLATGDSQLTATDYFQAVALDDTYVYWISYDDGMIKRIAKPQ